MLPGQPEPIFEAHNSEGRGLLHEVHDTIQFLDSREGERLSTTGGSRHPGGALSTLHSFCHHRPLTLITLAPGHQAMSRLATPTVARSCVAAAAFHAQLALGGLSRSAIVSCGWLVS